MVPLTWYRRTLSRVTALARKKDQLSQSGLGNSPCHDMVTLPPQEGLYLRRYNRCRRKVVTLRFSRSDVGLTLVTALGGELMVMRFRFTGSASEGYTADPCPAKYFARNQLRQSRALPLSPSSKSSFSILNCLICTRKQLLQAFRPHVSPLGLGETDLDQASGYRIRT